MKARILSTIIAAVSLAFVPGASALIIGTPADANTGNCFPFGCGFSPTPYQQIYGASNFTHPIAISSLSFFHTEYTEGVTTPNLGTFTISLSTTAAAVDGLSTIAADNLGADNTVVFSGPLPSPVPFGSQMEINFSTIFDYSPALGNLLMNVDVTGLSQPSGDMFFDMTSSRSDQMSRFFGNDTDSVGLVTGINGTVRIPEPATLLLVGLVLVALGLSKRETTRRGMVQSGFSRRRFR